MDIEVNYKVPVVTVRKIVPNEHYFYAKSETEKWISNIINKKWTDKTDLVGCTGFMFPTCKDPKKLTLIAKIVTWIFMLDDYLDRNPDKMDDWVKILTKKKIVSDSLLEKMFEDFMPEIMPELSYIQQKRFIISLIKFITSYKTANKIKSGELKVSLEEYWRVRFSDCAREAMFVLAEYSLGINMDRFWDMESYLLFHNIGSEHGLIFNDLISFKKELKEDGGMYNYVYILSKKMNYNFQEAADYAAKQLNVLDIKFIDKKRKLISINNGIPIEYLDEMDNFKDGSICWAQNSSRY